MNKDYISIRFKFLKNARFWVLTSSLIGLGFCLTISIFSYLFNEDVHWQTAAITGNSLPSIAQIAKMRVELNEGRRAEASKVFGGNCPGNKCDVEANKRRRSLFAIENNYGKYLISSAEEEVIFDSYIRQRNIYFASQDILLASTVGSEQLRDRFLSESANGYADVLAKISNLNEFNLVAAQKSQKEIERKFLQSRKLLIWLMAVLGVTLAILVIWIAIILTKTKAE